LNNIIRSIAKYIYIEIHINIKSLIYCIYTISVCMGLMCVCVENIM
jgi:hypothetical protein